MGRHAGCGLLGLCINGLLVPDQNCQNGLALHRSALQAQIDVAPESVAAELNGARSSMRNPAVKRRGVADDAIWADHRGFNHFAGRQPDHQRDDCPGREIPALIGSPGVEQYLLLVQKDRLEMRMQRGGIGCGESESSSRLGFGIEWRSVGTGGSAKNSQLPAPKGIADNSRKLRPLADKARHLFSYVGYGTDASMLAGGRWFSGKRAAMDHGCYDPETLTMLRGVLDEVWDALPADRQARMPKSEMAERILRRAADGERDRARLKAAALLVAVQWTF